MGARYVEVDPRALEEALERYWSLDRLWRELLEANCRGDLVITEEKIVRAKAKIAEVARVPKEHRSILIIRIEKSGSTSIFIGEFEDRHHGHYVFDTCFEATYRREYGEPRGSHNHIRRPVAS